MIEQHVAKQFALVHMNVYFQLVREVIHWVGNGGGRFETNVLLFISLSMLVLG